MSGVLAKVGFGAAVVLVPPVVAVALLTGTDVLSPPTQPGAAVPGALTLYGLPVARVLRDLSAALCIGSLILAATVLPATSREAADVVAGVRGRMLVIAAVAGSVWVWSGVAYLTFAYGSIMGLDPFAPGGLRYLQLFVATVDTGRALLASSTLAAVATMGAMITRRATAVGVSTLVALAALWPLASTRHGAGAVDHDVAVNAQMVHLVGMSVWAGGLMALLLVWRFLPSEEASTATRRYSVMAGWAAAAVGVSGLLSATTALGGWSDLSTDYGRLLMVKTAALTLLVVAGWWHRRRILPRLDAEPSASGHFLVLAAVEVVVLVTTVGVAVALSGTPPPPGEEPTSAAEALLGYPLPPPLDVTTFFVQWRVDTLWSPIALIGVIVYVVGVTRLRRRGDRWPVGRTVAWIIGGVLLVWATSGSPGAYGRVLFSMHMLQHMVIAIAAPSLLVLGAPATLALRTLPTRFDGSRGAREWLLVLLHSKWLGVLGHPMVAAAVWVGSLVVFYSSSLFEASLRSQTVHLLMVFHFLVSGYLLASAICGIDPGPKRVAYPFRVLILMMTFGAHALFNVSLMAKTQVLAGDWFEALGRTWGNDLLRDQYIGAQLGWVAGDYPIAILGGALIWSWVRSDRREARRLDRQADRDDDSELRRYNQYLASLQDRR